MKARQIVTYILVGLVILLGALAYLWAETHKKPLVFSTTSATRPLVTGESPQQSTTISQSQPLSQSQRKAWNIYTNQQYQFTLQYPPEWTNCVPLRGSDVTNLVVCLGDSAILTQG